MSIRVFNTDDHPILRKGVSDLLKETQGIEWVGSADNGKSAIEKIRQIKPNVAILYIEMRGLEVAKMLLEEGISTHFIVLTLFKDETLLKKALEIGIKGYLLNESSECEILDCVHSVAKGQAYVNASLTQYLIPNNKERIFFVIGNQAIEWLLK